MRDSVCSLLDDATRRGDGGAFRCRQGLRWESWSGTSVRATAVRLARELEARGIERGDRILLLGRSRPEWVAAFFGGLVRGAVMVPLEERTRPDFLRRVQDKVRAKLLIEDALVGVPSLDGLPRLPLGGLEASVAQHEAAPFPAQDGRVDDLVEIVFTSGTTSEPKGVCLTHRNLLANLAPVEEEIARMPSWTHLFRPVRLLSLLPLSHLFGQYLGIFVPLLLRGEVLFGETLKPSELAETIRRERVEILAAVPRQIEALKAVLERQEGARGRAERFRRRLEAAGGWSFPRRLLAFRGIHRRFGFRFWVLVSGAATLRPETEAFWRLLGFVLVQGYGLTEASSLVTAHHPLRISPGTVGKALAGQEVRLGPGGEILVRGANVSPGYWADGIVPLTDAEGWLHTGDIAERDASGAFIFRDRVKDVIVTADGQNVYPADLERALEAQPEVASCAVVAIAGPYGPEPAAVLVLRESGADPGAILRRANDQLLPHQQIRRAMVWPERDLPRTPVTGKVRRRQVADAVERAQAGDERPSAVSSPLAEAIASVSGKLPERLSPTLDLATGLQLDSLGRMELLSAIEDRFQVELDEASIGPSTTLGDLERMLDGRGGPGSGPEPSEMYPQWPLTRAAVWLRAALTHLLVLPVTRLLCFPRAVGRELLAAERGPLLFVANHVTLADHVLILSALPERFRHRLTVAMEAERLWSWRRPLEGLPVLVRLFRRALYLFVAAAFNVFPLPRQSGFRRSFARAGPGGRPRLQRPRLPGRCPDRRRENETVHGRDRPPRRGSADSRCARPHRGAVRAGRSRADHLASRARPGHLRKAG
jgi:long-chain acyl-CoA synthetase